MASRVKVVSFCEVCRKKLYPDRLTGVNTTCGNVAHKACILKSATSTQKNKEVKDMKDVINPCWEKDLKETEKELLLFNPATLVRSKDVIVLDVNEDPLHHINVLKSKVEILESQKQVLLEKNEYLGDQKNKNALLFSRLSNEFAQANVESVRLEKEVDSLRDALSSMTLMYNKAANANTEWKEQYLDLQIKFDALQKEHQLVVSKFDKKKEVMRVIKEATLDDSVDFGQDVVSERYHEKEQSSTATQPPSTSNTDSRFPRQV